MIVIPNVIVNAPKIRKRRNVLAKHSHPGERPTSPTRMMLKCDRATPSRGDGETPTFGDRLLC